MPQRAYILPCAIAISIPLISLHRNHTRAEGGGKAHVDIRGNGLGIFAKAADQE